MSKSPVSKPTYLILPLLLITAVSMYLLSHSTKSTCLIQTINGFSPECPEILPEVCQDGPSFFIKTQVITKSATLNEEISCPWKPSTSVISLLALIFSAVFFIVLFFTPKQNQNVLPIRLAISSISAFLSLLITVIIMAIDLSNGRSAGRAFLSVLNQYYSTEYTADRVESRGDQKSYYTEFALIVILFVAVTSMIVHNFRKYRNTYKLAFGQPAQELELDNMPIISEGNDDGDIESSRAEEGIAV